MVEIFALATGTLIGGFSRYYLAGFIHRILGSSFPYGTLIINLIGCFLIGLFSSLAERFVIGQNGKLLLMIGFCGAFTTFSTFMLETANLIREGQSWHAFLNVMVSVAIGFILFRFGMHVEELLS